MAAIRQATIDDLGEIYRMVRSASAELAERFGTPDSSLVIEAGVRHGIIHNQAVVVAEDEGKLVGFVAWVWFDASPVGQVEGLGTWVDPEYRRRHLSARMRQVATARCRDSGAAYVVGAAAVGNIAGMESMVADGWHRMAIQMRKDF